MGQHQKSEPERNRVTVTIFDQKYIIKGEEEQDYLEKIADYVDRQMHQINKKNSRLPPLKVAVLAALNSADELHKLQKDYDELIRLIEEEKKN